MISQTDNESKQLQTEMEDYYERCIQGCKYSADTDTGTVSSGRRKETGGAAGRTEAG